jgi:hypothetical protein
MDSAYFERDLRYIGEKIRSVYNDLELPHRSVKLKIDSAGGREMARGHGNYDRMAAMMLEDFNINIIQQPGNTPMYNLKAARSTR